MRGFFTFRFKEAFDEIKPHLESEINIVTNWHENTFESSLKDHYTALIRIIEAKSLILERYVDSLPGISFNDGNKLIQKNLQHFKQYLTIGYLTCQSGSAQLTWLLGK